MDIGVQYLGLTLKSPIIVGSGPLDQTVELASACEEAGAGMLVMHSLFEEQFIAEQSANYWSMEHGSGPDPLELSEVEDADAYVLRPEEYYQRVAELKQQLRIPIVGSINGIHPGNWVMYAQEMEEAGADAVELNIYDPVIEGDESGADVEGRLLNVVRLVRQAIQIPLAIKLSPFYSSFGHLARQLDNAGADALVLFNRFYQPDIDTNNLRVYRNLRLSSPDELPLRLRWAAALSGRIRANLCIAGGVHSGIDVIKGILAGAHAVQTVSAVVKHGPSHIAAMLDELAEWMTRGGSGTASLASLRGRLSLEHTQDRSAYERANYVQLLRDRTGVAP
jgi:dihydroorotate dehydrogenase (fumarate)